MKIKNFTITNWFNSKYHGVPQNRERVYTLGHLGRYGERKVFPLRGADEKDNICKVKQIAQQNSAHRKNLNQYRVYDSKGLSPCLNKMDGGGREPHIPKCIGGIDKGNKKFGKQFAQQDRVYDGSQVATSLTSQLSGNVNNYAIPMFGIDYNSNGKEREIANALTTRNNANGVENVNQDGATVCVPMCIDPQGRTSKEVKPSDTAPTLRAQAHGNNPEISVLTPDRAEKRQNGRRFKDNGEESFTLTAQDKHGVAISEVNGVPVIWYEKYKCYIAIRKLTPKECFRLQSFSDEDFAKAQFVNSDSQLYKQAGNSVTVNVVYDIAKAIGETYENKRNT